jgi:hypothetical protein
MGPADELAEDEILAFIDGYAHEAGPAALPAMTVVIGSSLYLLHLPNVDRDGEAWEAKRMELADRRIFIAADEDDDEPTYSGQEADLYLLRTVMNDNG